MKILMLCNKLPYPANDGSSIAMAKMIEGFVGQNQEVFVLCTNTKKHYKNIQSIPKEIKNKVTFYNIDVNTNPTLLGAFVNLFQKLPFHVSRFFQPKVAQILRQILAQHTFDVVQIEGIFMMPYYSLIKKHSPAKIALRTHNVEHQIWQRILSDKKMNFALRLYLKYQIKKLKNYENWGAKQADAVVAISKNDAEYFGKLNAKTTTIACGILKPEPIKKIAKNQFFHLGAMDWMPNQQAILWLIHEVWPLVMAQNNALQLHLAGRHFPENIKNLAVQNVHIHGEVDNAKNFRAAHGIMLVPLQAGSGIRIKIIEGLAEGIPIISTPIGAEGIDAKNNREIVLAQTPTDFANAIVNLAKKPEKCVAIGKNAAHLAAEKFDNNKLAAELVAFYAW